MRRGLCDENEEVPLTKINFCKKYHMGGWHFL